jgi:hypothetical protein
MAEIRAIEATQAPAPEETEPVEPETAELVAAPADEVKVPAGEEERPALGVDDDLMDRLLAELFTAQTSDDEDKPVEKADKPKKAAKAKKEDHGDDEA